MNSLSMIALGSGSQGNSYYIFNDENAVLIDCGISTKQIFKRLEKVGIDRPKIDAVFITHEHTDHIASCAILERKMKQMGKNLPFYMSSGTFHSAKIKCLPKNLTLVGDGAEVTVGSLDIEAFDVPHDGIGTMGYRVGFDEHWAGVITDIGHVSDVVLDKMRSLSMMAFEFNHDIDMLMYGDYPEFTKERIRADWGHLSNDQAAKGLKEAVSPRLQHLILAHISRSNNIPDIAEKTAAEALEDSRHADIVSLHVASQFEPSPIFSVDRKPQKYWDTLPLFG